MLFDFIIYIVTKQMPETLQQNLIHFISHEIKGWLTKNQAAFAAIAEGDVGTVPTEVKQFAEHALEDTRRGVETLTDILNAASHRSGAVKYNREVLDLKHLLQDVVHKLSRTIRNRPVTIRLDMDETPIAIEGDKVQIRDHVVRNLIDNAIKYTKQGEIIVSLRAHRDCVTLSVRDTGVGICEEDMDNLFTQGGRGRNATKVNAHSTGYGLYIAKEIVEAHNGRIWAESEGEGKGSRFCVEFNLDL